MTVNHSSSGAVTADSFIAIMNEKFKSGAGIFLTVTGNSMQPFLSDKCDKVYLTEITEKPNTGDIIFYRRTDGSCVLHRIVKCSKDGFYFAGDAQNFIEGPLNGDLFLAECKSALRRGKFINEKNFIWFFFKHIWRRIIPVRRFIMSLYSKICIKKSR
ncbi:MAG: S24/S26 family peptidase [Clostridiales bacterium]|nr:S24/S26 family peptidase [Clostridiales bacterium]